MAGTTPRLALPYPNGTDIGGQGDAAIKSLAETLDTKLDFSTMPDGIGRRARNLTSYSEAVSNGVGYILIQTNIPTNSSVMSMLRLTGFVYEADNGFVDIAFTFYPYSADSSILVPEVTNMGSFHVSSVQFLNKTSNNTVAIALISGSATGYWQYPKLTLDGIFGHNLMTDAQLSTGWSISRVINLDGYTVKATPMSPRPSAEDSGWITPTLNSGWTQYNINDWPVQYRRKAGIVHIRGLVVGTGTTSIFNLPAGFRPLKNTLRGAIDAGVAMKQMYVTAAGDIYPAQSAHPAWLSLENITFPADA